MGIVGTSIYGLVMFIFFIIFLVNFFRHLDDQKGYKKLALALTFLWFITEIIIFSLYIDEGLLKVSSIFFDLLMFGKVFMFASLGIYYSRSMNNKDAPILRKGFDKENEINFIEIHKGLAYSCMVVIVALAYTYVLFKFTSPQLPGSTETFSELGKENDLILSTRDNIVVLIVVIQAAIGEEILFRLGIQNFLAHSLKLQEKKYWIAIVITAFLWALGHSAVLDPAWVKIAQIFPIGILLGILYEKFGIECAILSHSVFNVATFLLQGFLIS